MTHPVTFSAADLRALGACEPALARAEAFGGAIENSPAGWQAYINAYPESWTDPVWLAWQLHRTDHINCPGLVWAIARIAFREQPEVNLRVYGTTLGPDNWREAIGAVEAAHAALATYAYAAYAAVAAAEAAHFATAATYAYATYANTAPEHRERIRAEIIALAVAALEAFHDHGQVFKAL